ncbi:hypothetical protein RvY_00664 [Ramazzottius varieornatus]|uniref:IPT/TIG domain-containing protein n=1 Tax=Ramazzottius varieornatus TaxID=947166 RepID=A0A1D1UHL5_RAMVA|nr:hypothetical protein RvY_00664 [Ramazzottius varieornatus]
MEERSKKVTTNEGILGKAEFEKQYISAAEARGPRGQPGQEDVVAARHLPVYDVDQSHARHLSAEILIDISLGEHSFQTNHAFPSAKGDVVFHQKWTLRLAHIQHEPISLKAIDKKLGMIGSHDIPLETLRFYPRWDIHVPAVHWTFVPKSDEIEARQAANRSLHIHAKPCEVEIVIVISKQERFVSLTAQATWWKCCRRAATAASKPVPFHRTRRWIVRDMVLQELEFDFEEVPHEWTNVAVSVQPAAGTRRLGRSNPNRQAFLKQQSRGQNVDLLLDEAQVQNKLLDPNTIGQSLFDANTGGHGRSVLTPETTITPAIESATQRFIGKERSLTKILNVVETTELRPVGFSTSLWKSLPNLAIESEAQGDLLRAIVSKRTSYFSKLGNRPVISSIIPRRVSIKGGTFITVNGQNLGKSKEDVLQFLVCGQNCLDTMEYLSMNKLRCRSKPFVEGLGTVVVVTRSGGRSHCPITFEFYDPSNLQHLRRLLEGHQNNNDELDVDERVKLYELAVEQEISHLVATVASLEQNNLDVRDYLDNLERRLEKEEPALLQEHRNDPDLAIAEQQSFKLLETHSKATLNVRQARSAFSLQSTRKSLDGLHPASPTTLSPNNGNHSLLSIKLALSKFVVGKSNSSLKP